MWPAGQQLWGTRSLPSTDTEYCVIRRILRKTKSTKRARKLKYLGTEDSSFSWDRIEWVVYCKGSGKATASVLAILRQNYGSFGRPGRFGPQVARVHKKGHKFSPTETLRELATHNGPRQMLRKEFSRPSKGRMVERNTQNGKRTRKKGPESHKNASRPIIRPNCMLVRKMPLILRYVPTPSNDCTSSHLVCRTYSISTLIFNLIEQ